VRPAALPAVLLLALLAGAPSAAGTADLDLPAGGSLRSTIFPSSETETVRVDGPAGAVLEVDLRRLGRSRFRPSLLALLSDGSPVSPPPAPSGRVRASLPFPVDGTCTLLVGSESGSGHYRLRARLRPRAAGLRPSNSDLRDRGDPSALAGPYSLLAANLGGAAGPLPSLLTGGVEFRRRGRARTDLRSLALPAAGGALPPAEPIPARAGTWFSDGEHASIALDLGAGRVLDADYALAAGGEVLHAGLGDPGASLVSLLLRDGGAPTTASLAGAWTYAVAGGGLGDPTLEAGTLTLGAGGTVSGFGVRTAIGAGGAGAPEPILRGGSFSVAADGTVVLRTTENFFGPTSAWEVRDAFAGDVLAGLPTDAGGTGLRLLLRQGTGLGNSDFEGEYLHLGFTLGASTSLRSGVLVLDGAGAFSGTGSVIPLGGEPQGGVAVSGTYSVNALGNATLAFSGGGTGTGVAGPDARYLFAVGAGPGGVAADLLIRAE